MSRRKHRTGRPIDPEQRWLAPRQAALVMGCSEYLVYKLADNGKIPGSRKLGAGFLSPENGSKDTLNVNVWRTF